MPASDRDNYRSALGRTEESIMGRQQLMLVALGCAWMDAGVLGDTARYTVTDLGTVPGSTVCPCFFGVGLSENGKAVGRFFGSNGLYAGFSWQNGVMTDIGSLGGGLTQALDVRDDGTVVGHSRVSMSSNTERAFRYLDGQWTDLGTLVGGTHSYARAINNAGVVAGMSTGRAPGNEDLQRAVIWSGGQITDLGTFGGEFSEGFDINNVGQVVGWAWDAARRARGFVWSAQGGMVDLGDFGVAGSVVGRAVSDLGVVVGSAPVAGGNTHAFRWIGGVMTDLGVLPEAGQPGPFGPELMTTVAAGVNSLGHIVGSSYPASNQPPLRPGPWIWQEGVMRNLNDLVGPGWVIEAASGINDAGQIIGTARSAVGELRAVLLTPILCYANCDSSTTAPLLNVGDFTCFLQRFAAGDSYANCDGSTTAPALNVGDFTCFLQRFGAACP
jgi:probable HAF family extracellular repeat protein